MLFHIPQELCAFLDLENLNVYMANEMGNIMEIYQSGIWVCI